MPDVLRLVLVALGALLMTVSFAVADDGMPTQPAAVGSAGPGLAPGGAPPSSTPDLAGQVAARAARLVPQGMRLQGVTLGCKPPADATLDSVAPGLAQLVSRGFLAEFRSKGRLFACSATATIERRILAAAHDMEPNQPASKDDFEPRWVDAYAQGVGALADFPPQGPYVTATVIRAGQPLFANELRRPIVVHPGDRVAVLVKNGPVTVRARLEARSSAALGETTTMLNPASGNPVAVTVTGPRTAELVMQ